MDLQTYNGSLVCLLTLFFRGEVTPSSAQDLLLFLCSRIALGGVRGPSVVQGIELGLVMCKQMALPFCTIALALFYF